MARLEIKGVSKDYEKETRAVDNLSLDALDGEFLVLVGPSGCGKSTVLRLIAGLEEITDGKILINGKIINEAGPKDRNIGMVFQNYALYPHMTVYENLAFPLKILKYKKTAIEAQVKYVAKKLELDNYLHRKPRQLSGGQRQRVALGRAIVRQPDIFLFDEPLSNLDAKLRVQMRNEILSLQRELGTTTIYVTHDQVEAMTMGTKLAIMNKGVLQQFDTPENVYFKPENKFVASFIGSPQMNFLEGIVENGYFKSGEIKFFIGDNVDSFGEITIGIRPEHLNLSTGEDGLQITVENIENLGHEFITYFRIDGHLNCLRSPEKPTYSIGNRVCIIPSLFNLHLFDKKGKRIDTDASG